MCIRDSYKGNQVYLSNVEVGLIGSYQQYNLPGVLMVVEELRKLDFDISEHAIREGLRQVTEITGFKGRWQVLSKRPYIVCDTAHNEAGIKEVVGQIDRYGADQVHVVMGVVNDKDLSACLLYTS